MALIAMAVFDSFANNRTWLTRATLVSLAETVDWARHRLIVVDNASCEATQALYAAIMRDSMPLHLPFTLLQQKQNLGTAAAINLAWQLREPGEHCVKIDNDVVVYQAGWADLLEEVFERAPGIGICGLKRKDLGECTWGKGSMKSTLRMLPHEAGQRWLIVEEVQHVFGTCQMFNSDLLETIGYLYQMQDSGNLYGFDDSLASVRSRLAGYTNCFLCGIEIEHLDPGGDAYTEEKRQSAAKWLKRYGQVVREYEMGARDIYYE